MTSYNFLKSEINGREKVRAMPLQKYIMADRYKVAICEVYQETIAAMTCDTYMDKKTGCCTANLTIGPKAAKKSPFNSCLSLKGRINDGDRAQSIISEVLASINGSYSQSQISFLGTNAYVLHISSVLTLMGSTMKDEIMKHIHIALTTFHFKFFIGCRRSRKPDMIYSTCMPWVHKVCEKPIYQWMALALEGVFNLSVKFFCKLQ